MADTSNIRLSPELMSQKASEFDAKNAEFNELIEKMGTMVTELTDEWAGQSSQAFYDQFESLKPSLQQTSQLIADIATQLRNVSQAMQDVDAQIAGQING